ncbi:MAG: hypothetical protein HN356_09860 [Calditrichaeota bacterium]|nr:hypothetical protein [Calditrichota bacterium]MBT7617923.1 hypothetical protein [Calditrichota bacterium]
MKNTLIICLMAIFLLASLSVFAGEVITDNQTTSFSLMAITKGPVRDNPDDFSLQFGWPNELSGSEALWGQSITVMDFDGFGDWELAIMNTENRLHVFQHDAANYPGFPMRTHIGNRPRSWVNPRHNATTAAGDFSGNGLLDMVFATDIGYLHVVGEDEVEPDPFPLDLGLNFHSGVPLLTDLEGDGELEIILNTYSSDPDSSNTNALLHVIKRNGEELDNWPVAFPRGSGSSPVCGDIDNDGSPEIIIGNSRHLDDFAQIWAWEVDGSVVDGFPFGNFHTIAGSPSLADINGDGAVEILFWAAIADQNTAGVYAINGNGEILDGFPVECVPGHPEGNPVVADINGDGSPEIIFGTFNPQSGGSIHAWTATGDILDSFPIQLDNSVVGSALLADMSGDGVTDIVAALTPLEGNNGLIAAWDSNGNVLDGFPISLQEYGGGVISATPTIWDIDEDGDLDMLAVTTDRRIFIWDTPGQLTMDVWLTYKADMSRTGLRPADNPVSAPFIEDKAFVPSSGEVQAFPNPFNSSARIVFKASPLDYERLELVDLAGRLIAKLQGKEIEPGKFEAIVDSKELGLTAGIYFCRIVSKKNNFPVTRLLYMP